jgi:glycosyltransferase involved in cell wall biosynthesis
MLKNSGIYHFLYPETVLSDFNYPVPAGVKIVSTFHQPPERYEKYLSKKENYRQLLNYRKTDYAIALGQEQVPLLRKLLQHDRIDVIPHGVDINFFKPGGNIETNEKLVLIVGNWMRDFVLARKVIEIFEERDKQVKFIVVTRESNRRYFEGLGNVSFFTGITDEELLGLYNKSRVLFLPLAGAIANNALLEALSCNLPVLVSDLPTLDYLAGTDGIYLFDNNNIDDTAAKLSQLLNESNQIKKKGTIRDFALQFRWENISDMVLNVYKRI